ncbi:OmpA family protein [Spongiimicrobium salis]|uniref:OmpA family protein n=1 Tax=Spongiimicrobium salis TaxID=1667022 RepID=UPI00374CB291
MKFRIAIIFLVMNLMGNAQDIQSKGDALYFQYAYKDAIVQYNKEALKKPLSNTQLLNLADSYLKEKKSEQALEVYLEVHQKDFEMPTHDVNKMLQSMAKISGLEAVQSFLKEEDVLLSKELTENANFNFELLESDMGNEKGITVFNSEGNSPQSDFSPSFYKEKLLFASGRPKPSKKKFRRSTGFLNIYVAKISNQGKLMNPNAFEGIPKTNFHNATPFYSEALESILFIRSNAFGNELAYDKNGKNALAMGIVDLNGDFRMLLSDLSTSFYYPYYDAKNSKLYFTANFEDSYGGTDIYYVHTNNGQIMSAPINLGPRINTPGNDMAPYIFNNSLYFSSDVFYGQGGMDIYRSNFQPDGSFSTPVNLGEGINSDSDDFGFIIREGGTQGFQGYFASNRQGGNGDDDIYGFYAQEKPGLRTIIVKGQVRTTNSGDRIANARVKVLDANKEIIKELVTANDGTYAFEIPWRKEIVIEISKNKYSSFTKVFGEQALNENEEYAVLDVDMVLLDDLIEDKENETVLKLKKFYFQRYKAVITPEIALELDRVVSAVKAFPKLQLQIETHTDSRGGSTTNLRLSQRRSQAILNYLLEKGVSQDNIVDAIGYGESKIINNCTNGVYCLDFLHKKNERSNVIIKNYDQLK